MAFWGRQRWLREQKRGYKRCPVLPWNDEKLESAGYRLSVGREFFVNGSGSSTVLDLEKNQGFVIEPGQFAFILTEEKVYISYTAIGFISIRASTKFRGLVNVSGFQVNPGFNGNLIFAVFNAGPRHINLRRGDEIFSLWIADLDAEVTEDNRDHSQIPNNLDKIPSDEVNKIAGKTLTAYQLSERLEKVEKSLDLYRTNLIRVGITLSAILATISVLATIFREPLVEYIQRPSTLEQELRAPSSIDE